MSDSIRTYLLSIVAVSLLTAILLAVVPKNPVRRICVLVCGLLMILVCLSPFSSLDLTGLAQSIARSAMASDAAQSGIEVHSRDLIATLIKQRAESYILDKAEQMGLSIAAEVTVDTDGTYPYPSGVIITGSVTAEQREALSAYIESNLAVDAASQEWVDE